MPGSTQPFDGLTRRSPACPTAPRRSSRKSTAATLYHNIRSTNGIWQGWRPIGGPDGSDSNYTGSAVIASLPNGSSQIFTTTIYLERHLEDTRASSGIWSGWTLLNGYQTAVSAAGFGSVS